jgi:flagellar hook-associated protein 1
MAILGSSFQIGRSAISAYQAALAVTGQNIANVGNPNYTRQSAHLSALAGGHGALGFAAGAGVTMSHLQRHFDVALEDRLRNSLSTMSAAELQQAYLTQVETIYAELTDQDLSTALGDLYGSFGALQTTPEDSGARNIVIADAQRLIDTITRHRTELIKQVDQMNDAAEASARQASEIASEIASLNQTITFQEADKQTVAGALRDRRDTLLKDLSELADINVRQHENGIVDVYIGSDPLVQFDQSRGLEVERRQENGFERTTVVFADDNGPVTFRDGKLAGIVNTRDEHVVKQIEQLDDLARSLIYEVNVEHATGRGLVGRTSVTSVFGVGDSAAALNSAAAATEYPLQHGSFEVKVRDGSGQETTHLVKVDLDGVGGPDTSLDDVAAALSAISVDGQNPITATVLPDNRLQIEASEDYEFWFSNDSSNLLGSLGVNAFFTGTHAGNIALHADIVANPSLIAASATGERGDGGNAGLLSKLADASSSLLSGFTPGEFHDRMISTLAVHTAAARSAYDAADAVHSSLVAQREAISGVSLDEEVLDMTVYQRAFQGASRYLNVVEQLSQELLALVR